MTGQSNGAAGPMLPGTLWLIGGLAVCFGFYALAGLNLSWPRAARLLSVAVGHLGVGAFYYGRTKSARSALALAFVMEILWAAAIVI